MKTVATAWFRHDRVSPDLLRIIEPCFDAIARANLWLLTGRDRHVLIDTGLGVSDLAAYLVPLIDKPLLVVATHVHFDHAGGMADFSDNALHALEVDAMERGDAEAALAKPEQGFNLDDHFHQLPYEGFTAVDYRFKGAKVARHLVEGDVIDLGDKTLQVMHVPGHSPGSIALYEPAQRRLFSGDVLYEGALVDDAVGCCACDYVASMQRLARLDPSIVFPGHYATFGARRMRELIEDYLASRRSPGCPLEHRLA